jgi:hypothetical protein
LNLSLNQWRKWEPEFPFAFKRFRFMLYRDRKNDKIPEDLCPL